MSLVKCPQAVTSCLLSSLLPADPTDPARLQPTGGLQVSPCIFSHFFFPDFNEIGLSIFVLGYPSLFWVVHLCFGLYRFAIKKKQKRTDTDSVQCAQATVPMPSGSRPSPASPAGQNSPRPPAWRPSRLPRESSTFRWARWPNQQLGAQEG